MKTKLILFLIVISVISCKKSTDNTGNGSGNGNGNGSGNNTTPTDPAVANTIGFFLNDWSPKSFTIPSYADTTLPSGSATASVTIDGSTIITKIPKSIFGQNSNSWMGQIVTVPTLMTNINNLHAGVIRFPGGSISDMYFWNKPYNTPPPDVPSQLLDANGIATAAGYWGGMTNDNWTISIDSYYQLLQQTGNNGMITVNYGYARYGTSADPVAAAAHLAADWVRYDNGRTKYWEIGNECNGTWEAGYRINTATNKDGQPQIITGALYGQHVKVFADSMRKAAQEIGKTIYIGAYLLEAQPQSWQTATDQSWNSGVLAQINNTADFYIIHSYYTPYQTNSNADVILNSAVDNTAAIMNYVQSSINSAGAAMKPIALTEWNINAEGSMQKVSYINGMHAAILLGEAIKNKYGETSRWDLANAWDNGNDHGLFNIGDEPNVSIWNPRPAFYYMYYFQKMIGDRLLRTTTTANILAYASSFTSGEKGVILVNRSTDSQIVQVTLQNASVGNRFYWYTLTGGTDNGEFSGKVFVNGKGPDQPSGGPASSYTTLKAYSSSTQNGIKIGMPPRSVVYVVIDKQ
jgi:hypothetical protein